MTTRRTLIVRNDSSEPVFIVYKWQPDPLGGPAKVTSQACVPSGQCIDLDMLGFVLVQDPLPPNSTYGESAS